MTYSALEWILQNGSFASLLLSTLFFWGDATLFNSFVNQKNRYCQKNWIGSKGKNLLCISSLLLATTLTSRWFISGHPPLSNLYESLLWLCWGIIFFCLLSNRLETTHPSIIAVLSSSALFIHGFASLSLPSNMQAPNSLVPALQSNWLLMHVSVMMISYSCLLCGGLLSLIFLTFSYNPSTPFFSLQTDKNNRFFFQQVQNYSFLKALDQISVRSIGTGFCLLTLGILSGAVWANEAWGSYWSWDPKETWALITWLIFATYLHLRVFQGWQGQKSAMLAFIGLISLWICYLGLNWLGNGLHTYGLFTK
uniref:cytochrome c biogenesis protein n=1 Tax=Interfilum massjukiae TaxID=519236 RepID=UPI00286A381E|nr:cytochrome c biogenesis protein [Interfilum massjukiae]WKT06079.1 cytochrome c biogenesis protein [Interfilum massjukiae]